MPAAISSLSSSQKRLSRVVLLVVAICQLLLPLSSSAAMRSASADSPFYCGQMSSPLVKQLLALDLPAELLEQVLPQVELDCDACAVTAADPHMVSAAQAIRLAELVTGQYSPANFDSRPLHFAATYSARAPPQ